MFWGMFLELDEIYCFCECNVTLVDVKILRVDNWKYLKGEYLTQHLCYGLYGLFVKTVRFLGAFQFETKGKFCRPKESF